jgi:hypothetical protein
MTWLGTLDSLDAVSVDFDADAPLNFRAFMGCFLVVGYDSV